MWFMVHKIIGVPINGSLAMYAFGVGVYLFSIAALGIMLATIAPTMPQFGLLMLPVFMVLLLFSGSGAPRSNMPGAAQGISEYSADHPICRVYPKRDLPWRRHRHCVAGTAGDGHHRRGVSGVCAVSVS